MRVKIMSTSFNRRMPSRCTGRPSWSFTDREPLAAQEAFCVPLICSRIVGSRSINCFRKVLKGRGGREDGWRKEGIEGGALKEGIEGRREERHGRK
jgi:hypothetical protein